MFFDYVSWHPLFGLQLLLLFGYVMGRIHVTNSKEKKKKKRRIYGKDKLYRPYSLKQLWLFTITMDSAFIFIFFFFYFDLLFYFFILIEV